MKAFGDMWNIAKQLKTSVFRFNLKSFEKGNFGYKYILDFFKKMHKVVGPSVQFTCSAIFDFYFFNESLVALT